MQQARQVVHENFVVIERVVHFAEQGMRPLVAEGLLELGVAQIAAQVDAVTGRVVHPDGVHRVRPAGARDDPHRDLVAVQLEPTRDLQPGVAVSLPTRGGLLLGHRLRSVCHASSISE